MWKTMLDIVATIGVLVIVFAMVTALPVLVGFVVFISVSVILGYIIFCYLHDKRTRKHES